MDKDRRKIRAEEYRVGRKWRIQESSNYHLFLYYDVSLKINCKQRKYYMSSIKQLVHF